VGRNPDVLGSTHESTWCMPNIGAMTSLKDLMNQACPSPLQPFLLLAMIKDTLPQDGHNK
jgi:hypothetical protein